MDETYAKVCELLQDGQKPHSIAETAGCGASTMYRIRKQLEAEGNREHIVSSETHATHQAPE